MTKNHLFNPKYWLLMFIRRFYNPDQAYINDVIRTWEDNLVRFIVDILVIGFMNFLVLISVFWILSIFGIYFSVGTNILVILFIIISLGLIIKFIKETYIWFRIDYKNKEGF